MAITLILDPSIGAFTEESLRANGVPLEIPVDLSCFGRPSDSVFHPHTNEAFHGSKKVGCFANITLLHGAIQDFMGQVVKIVRLKPNTSPGMES